jgi:hypothetical protein
MPRCRRWRSLLRGTVAARFRSASRTRCEYPLRDAGVALGLPTAIGCGLALPSRLAFDRSWSGRQKPLIV